MQLIIQKRGHRILPLLALAVATLVLLILSSAAEAGLSRGNFEIDANDTIPPPPGAPSGFSDLNNPLYSGQIVEADALTDPADDWAQGPSQEGVFLSAPLFGTGALNEDGGAAGDCADGIDNGDADGIDAADSDCHAVAGAHETVSTDCYDFHIDVNPDITGAPAFICDGNSDSNFDGNGGDAVVQPEKTIVSPSGKTPDNTWHIKSGQNPGDADFSHVYFLFRLADSPCDADLIANNPFFIMGGHRGDTEGVGFWGFEFNQVPPAGLQALINQTATDLTFKHNEFPGPVVTDGRSSNETLPLAGDDNGDSDATDRGDMVVSFTLTGGGLNPALDIFEFDEDLADVQFPLGKFNPLPTGLTCPNPGGGAPIVHTVLETNRPLNTDGDANVGDSQDALHDIEAPPWGVPACNPTEQDDGANSCRIAVGTSTESEIPQTPSPCDDTPGHGGTKIKCHLLPQLGFAEAVLDLTGLGIPLQCFNSLVFTTRSSHPLDGADLKDVGASNVAICGTKSGVKFHDRNADGTRDENGVDNILGNADDEVGLGGWEIHLFGDNSEHRHFSTCTAAQVADPNNVDCSGQPVGFYIFRNLLPGNYTACETIQSTWFQSAPSSGPDCTGHTGGGGGTASGKGYAVPIAFGTNDTGNDFGNFQPITKSGLKFLDRNADNARDADGVDNIAGNADDEVGLADWEIHLFGTDGLGNTVHQHFNTCDASDIDGTDLADADGNNAACAALGDVGEYRFIVNPPNTSGYTVCETLKSTWTQSFPTAGTGIVSCAGHTHLGAVTPGPLGYEIKLTSGQTDTDNNFGNFQNATKSGRKFKDLDADHTDDGGTDPGLGGVLIHLFGTDGAGANVHLHFSTCDASDIDGSDLADADGNNAACAVLGDVGEYTFSVKPGTYTVCETVPTGFEQTYPVLTPTPTTDAVACPTSPAHETASGVGYGITLTSGQVDSNNDFGNAQGSILIVKRAKSASAAGCTLATSPTPDPANCPLFGGATFKVTFTADGTEFATVTDTTTGVAPDLDARAGFVCLDSVPLNTSFTVEETASNNAAYSRETATKTTNAAAGACSGRSAATTGDVSFFNTPLSEIEVIFRSLAGGTPIAGAEAETLCDGIDNDATVTDDTVIDDGCTVTKAQISCSNATPETADDGGLIPGDLIGEDGAADTVAGTFDDYNEVFTALVPDTYTCTIIIDP